MVSLVSRDLAHYASIQTDLLAILQLGFLQHLPRGDPRKLLLFERISTSLPISFVVKSVGTLVDRLAALLVNVDKRPASFEGLHQFEVHTPIFVRLVERGIVRPQGDLLWFLRRNASEIQFLTR